MPEMNREITLPCKLIENTFEDKNGQEIVFYNYKIELFNGLEVVLKPQEKTEKAIIASMFKNLK